MLTVGVGGNGAYGWNSIGLSGDGTEAQGVWCRDCDRLAVVGGQHEQRPHELTVRVSPEDEVAPADPQGSIGLETSEAVAPGRRSPGRRRSVP